MKEDERKIPLFYHTTEEINNAMDYLLDICPLAKVVKSEYTPNLGEVELKKYSITSPKVMGKEDRKKIFLLFGEHARELISPELGVYFAESLCGQHDQDEESIKHILNTNIFEIVIDANPVSRLKVENGDYCLRVNENGVDLNRNWDDHWENNKGENEMTFSGSIAFSEEETRGLKKFVTDFMPDVFLTIHSGTYGMYVPYAFSEKEGTMNNKN